MVRAAPASAEVQVKLGDAYQGAKQWDKAQDAYAKAIELDEKNPQAYNNLAWLLVERGGRRGSPSKQRARPWHFAEFSSLLVHTYFLAPGKLPPVNAFWSITMYDGTSQLLVKNAIDRYLINSPMLPEMKKNKDGSLTVYIQKDSPGKAKESNWLPAPNGPMFVVMRLYWPKETPPSIFLATRSLGFPPQGPNQPQTGFGIREDAHHQRSALDLLIQPFQHVRARQMLVVRPR